MSFWTEERVAVAYNRVYVGNLPQSATEEKLIQVFSKYGRIAAVRIGRTQGSPSRTFAFITFYSEDGARTALQMNRQRLDGSPLRVDYVWRKSPEALSASA